MENPKTQKNPERYKCECCDFKSSHKNDYTKHLLTSKHKKIAFGNEMEIFGNEKTQKNPENYCCDICSKVYSTNSGLWKHKQSCKTSIAVNNNNTELVKYLMKENSELKNMILDVCKNSKSVEQNQINCNNTINSNNKSFNLQFFLNETCKDAMNIMDFVDSIKLQLSDLENVGQLGYVEGISKIIVSNLNSLDETKRPVHCADSKREVMYVKDENKWEKEDENKQKIRKMIKCVTRQNTKLLKDFRNKHPGCDKSDSKLSTKYDKLMLEAFGGKGDDDDKKEDKIIRNIVKHVTIDKTNNIV
jgi:hypothetical protein